jgi:hypothetical protein
MERSIKDNGKFTYLFCQGPCGLTPSTRMAGPSLTMKTTLLLHRNVSEYTSQCDLGNITVVVYVVRISLHSKDRRFSGGSAKRISCCKPADLVANFTRGH